MPSVLDQYKKKSRRRSRRAAKKHQRLEIQGLRMVAVLTVFACHLWGWPRGGFVGVDVFFVISGFLITGNLLRSAEAKGNVSFKSFYWNRVRRIIPAATVVLILTYLASVLVFLPFRSHGIGIDALFAAVFLSNWWFSYQGTDYFRAAANTVSPIQHYWSLSIEEQFYFVWPALIFLISVIVIRRAWTHRHRMQLAGAAMGAIVAASLGWALFQTAASPTGAYFNTFARVWELGVGALLATAVGVLARIPSRAKPVLSWLGLAVIVASVFLIDDTSVGFPAPWALLPVAGASLVIAAGVGGEPKYQGFLSNPASVYVGNISYSLYLVHWPVIVILGTLMAKGVPFSIAALTLAFGLAVASFHFVENPLRYADWGKAREAAHDILARRYTPKPSMRYAAVASASLVVTSLCAYVFQPNVHGTPPPPAVAAPAALDSAAPQWGPLTADLQKEIAQALAATDWPQLDPSMEAAIAAPESPPEVNACASVDVDPIDDAQQCTWGSPTAAKRIVIVGDSVATAYAGPLRELALHSDGQIQVHAAVTAGCIFVDEKIHNDDPAIMDACPARKQREVDLIKSVKPDVVVISNIYSNYILADNGQQMTATQWSAAMRRMIDKFRGSTKSVVLLSAPPADKNISDCYGARSSVPADCISHIGGTLLGEAWLSVAAAERRVADAAGGTWIDSRPWFCSGDRSCPAFVGSTPTKKDTFHMTLAYGEKIYPVMGESLTSAGVL